ncbi:protein translocase subunit SecF [Candidatus Kuenenbacteria bacterium]|nr:protein translocase subunit SecF [Candidatus Kuenenbacteria bacterium]
MLRIVYKRKIFFAISLVLFVAAIISLSLWGLKLGIDFTGGTIAEYTFVGERPDISKVKEAFEKENIQDIQIQPAGDKELVLRAQSLSEEEHQKMFMALKSSFGADQVIENKFESIGPVVGNELKNKAITALILTSLLIVLFIAYAFRKVSRPVPSWKYGVGAVIALIHDLVIVTGIFSALGHFWGYEIDMFFVTSLLTILGYSVNDTIVVYDRTRENLFHSAGETFEETVNRSINETIARSTNTGFATLLTLILLYFFGGETIRIFVLSLMLGIFFGTYSSIFVASPLLVVWQKLGGKK